MSRTMPHLLLALILVGAGASIFAAMRGEAVTLESAEEPVQVAVGADADTELFTRDILELLAQHDVEVIIEVHSSDLEKTDGEVVEITDELKKNGVRVWAWFLHDGPKGPFASDAAAEDYYAMWLRFLDWTTKNKLDYYGIALDFEPDKNMLKKLFGVGPLPNMVELTGNLNPERHAAAGEIYRKIFAESRAAGYKNYAVAYMTALDDQPDGDDDLQLAFGTPAILAEGIEDWNLDVISTMLYRPNAEKMGMVSTPYFVYSYARSMKKYFPERGTIVLKAWPNPDDDPGCEKLIGDLLLLKALGFNRIEIYSLQIILKEYGHDVLETILDSVGGARKLEFGKDPATVMLRDTFKRLDRQIGGQR